MLLGGLHRFSLIDYPGNIACTVFTPGCNLRCPYCHNPELVDPALCIERFLPELFFEFLKDRRGKLDAVVITGGEPTLQEDLPDFIEKIKSLRFLVKLDTNGTNPEMLERLLSKNLLDYIAMDIKTIPQKYPAIIPGEQHEFITDIEKSISLVINSGIDHEFRTTVVKNFITEKDIFQINSMISGARKYILQRFVSSRTLEPSFEHAEPFSDTTLIKLCEKLRKTGMSASWR